ncbi:MAG: HNH endonuclease [Gallionella sp.]|nr:HNH endonuclease [Gallionella sp.]MDD4958549.1 HNH endonuclease [Gallionella sp.]
MRPVFRGNSPQPADFHNYEDAKLFLVSRLGHYCSYCERYIATQLAVEHIQPKGLPAYAHLEGSWNNYLLACVNCNSTKKDKDVVFSDVLLPDRDNTFIAFEYTLDGRVTPSAAARKAGLEMFAHHTLSLTGLDKSVSKIFDENGKAVALDRVAQRLEVWSEAQDAKNDLDSDPSNLLAQDVTTKLAAARGFFSIWMTVFHDNPNMRNRLIDAFEGTRASGCFDPVTTLPISPASNPDKLPHGGKI